MISLGLQNVYDDVVNIYFQECAQLMIYQPENSHILETDTRDLFKYLKEGS